VESRELRESCGAKKTRCLLDLVSPVSDCPSPLAAPGARALRRARQYHYACATPLASCLCFACSEPPCRPRKILHLPPAPKLLRPPRELKWRYAEAEPAGRLPRRRR